MFKTSLFATILFSAFTAVAAPTPVSAPAQSPLVKSSVSLGESTQKIAPARACGYWDYQEVRVCDTVTETINKPVTSCEYHGYNRSGRLYEYSLNYDGHVTCPAPAQGAWLVYQSQTVEQVTQTREVNCRNEYRDVWVPIRCGTPIP